MKTRRRKVNHYLIDCIAAVSLLSGALVCSAPAQEQPRPNAQPGLNAPPDSRDRAIHDCNVAASKWSNMTWQSTQITTYRDCMTEHSQPE